jgi:hypothetical protein
VLSDLSIAHTAGDRRSASLQSAQYTILRDLQQQYVAKLRSGGFKSDDELFKHHLAVRAQFQRASAAWELFLCFVVFVFTAHTIALIGEPSRCLLVLLQRPLFVSQCGCMR